MEIGVQQLYKDGRVFNSSLMRDFYFNPAALGYAESIEKGKPRAPIGEITTKPAKIIAFKSAGGSVVVDKPLPDLDKLPQIVAPTDNLTMLYQALSEMRTDTSSAARLARSVSEDPYSNTTLSGTPAERANRVLKKLTGLEFTDAELQVMSKEILTVNANMAPVQPWAAPILGLNGESGLLFVDVMQGGIAYRAGVREGDV